MGNVGATTPLPNPQEGLAFVAPSSILGELLWYLLISIRQELGMPQEMPPRPPSDSLVLDQQVVEEDRMSW